MTGDLKKYIGAYLKESNPSPLKRSSYTPSLVSLEVTWLSFDAEIIKNILFLFYDTYVQFQPVL